MIAAPRRKAFTLLELVIAMSIVCVIAGALFACFQAAFHAKASAEAAVAPLPRNEVVMSFLRRDLESTLPITVNPNNPNAFVLASQFEGTTGQNNTGDILFDAAVDSSSNAAMPSDIRQVEYSVVPDGNSQMLVRSVISNLLAPTLPAADQEVICRGVQNFTVQYYDGTSWYDTWDSTQLQNAIPVAVGISLDLAPMTPGADPIHITRMIQLPCAVPATQPSTTGTTGSGT